MIDPKLIEIKELEVNGCELDHVLGTVSALFTEAGIETAGLDARLLLQRVLSLSHAQMVLDPFKPLTETDLQQLLPLVRRRALREPVSRILGIAEFWSLEFLVSPATLDPRPDTETLIEVVLDLIGERKSEPLRILDLGTGTGCVLLSLLSELPTATGLGVDISTGAVQTAGENAKRLGLNKRADFLISDWFSAVEGCFDVVVSNPPYIPTSHISGLAPEVVDFDPHSALSGGSAGLDDYKRIAAKIAPHLTCPGILAYEIGDGQAEDVRTIIEGSPIGPAVRDLIIRPDLSGMERVVAAVMAE